MEPAPEELQERLRKSRARVRALRADLAKQSAGMARLEAELGVLRAWSLDVFPEYRPGVGLARDLAAIRDERLTL